ncbi:type VI secretion system baseplate subunit TssF [Parashewanella curva]|uniref:Type VI secretion system baseplate subunit TssF n=1 Tax=Parashewanella curva TaxID=2338552 RepID=A0A3L8Q2T5_9GAMM|nr:type VI secretion system baseplate subunit TssF [Parashewanella curva]RLV61243.1 type VI secretion system baseplate subunit TssF [Parashewanella curva]
MSETMLTYFEQEQQFIRRDGAMFAIQHPGAANALGISKEGVDDPQISRLIESIALLNGRLQKRLDGSFPELTESLIQLLFPHYLRPIPSYAILNFAIDDSANSSHLIPALTEFDVKSGNQTSCIFRTTEDITLYPIKLSKVRVAFAPFDVPKPKGAEQAKALIEIDIETIDETILFSDLDIKELNLYLKGEANAALRLYDIVFQKTLEICVSTEDKNYVLGRNRMNSVGFELEESLLPYNVSSFAGFRLLAEFFTFPERFNAFRFDLHECLKQVDSNRICLRLFLSELSVDMARGLSTNNFCLFCVPIVNLHTMTADPVSIDFLKRQYPLILDSGQIEGIEVFSVDQVFDVTDGDLVKVPAIYSEKYLENQCGLRWQLVQESHEDGHIQSHLKVADLKHLGASGDNRTWLVKVTVTNGLKAGTLPLSSELRCRDSLTIPGTMRLLRKPSIALKRRDADEEIWSLLCHLHFNYQSILGNNDPKRTLKEVFHLYNHNQSTQNTAYIESINNIELEQIVSPIRVSGKGCFAYGTKITVTLDANQINGGLVLFSTLLDKFFSYFANFNSFNQLEIKLESQDEVYISFPRRSGCKGLL